MNAQDSDGQTALIYAILGDSNWPNIDPIRKKIICELLEAGADASLVDDNGLNAIYYYAQVAGMVPGFGGSFDTDKSKAANDPIYKKMTT